MHCSGRTYSGSHQAVAVPPSSGGDSGDSDDLGVGSALYKKLTIIFFNT